MYDYYSMPQIPAVVYLLILTLGIVVLVARWKYYEKLGIAGWKCLIPFYADYVLIQRCWEQKKATLYLVLTLVGIFTSFIVIGWFMMIAVAIMSIILKFKLANAFGKDAGFGIGLWLLAPIFEIILGFSNNIQAQN